MFITSFDDDGIAEKEKWKLVFNVESPWLPMTEWREKNPFNSIDQGRDTEEKVRDYVASEIFNEMSMLLHWNIAATNAEIDDRIRLSSHHSVYTTVDSPPTAATRIVPVRPFDDKIFFKHFLDIICYTLTISIKEYYRSVSK